ncbi:hypothetical protein D3C85_1482870 [compost metagenome]
MYTSAGILYILRLKSILRNFFFTPAPLCLTVIIPVLLRPALFFNDKHKRLICILLDKLRLLTKQVCLCEGVIGLNLRI